MVFDPSSTTAEPITNPGTVFSDGLTDIRVSGQAPAPAVVEVGSLLAGRYEILSVLGEGGMGAVYKARDNELDRTVALKIIRPELASRPEIVLRFKHELILARQITHKNVVRIYDIVVTEGLKFITMQFLEGRSLSSRIAEEGKLPIDQALAIFRQALQGLDAAHQEGVIHRDLKPHNIMVDASGRACLMDFGVASSIETAGMTRTGVLMGTPDYMSPEQARGERVDARSDLFSMGVILFQMLAGSLPYQSANSIGALVRRTQETAPPVRDLDPTIPEYLNEIVARCLEIRRERRYASASQILADLDSKQAPTQDGSETAAPPSAFHLPPGSTLGKRYRIDGHLGEGAVGTVYKAWDNDLGRAVALKLVRPELAGKASYLDKLKQEILLASRISHRHVLRIHDLGEADGVKFVSMAFVEGRDLHRLIVSEGRLPVPRAINLAKQICEGLEAAHNEGVVHRDLKPQNILVNGEDQVFISDFGLATSLGGETTAEMAGTPQYMAPEQVEGKPVDNRSDLYAFGLIVYELVTGSLPFESETVMQTMFQRLTVAPRNPKLLNQDLPDDLVGIILRCIEREPEARYQNAGEILAGFDSVGREPKRATIALAPTRRRVWPVVAAGCAAAGIITVAAIPSLRHEVLGLIRKPSRIIVNPISARYLAVLPLTVAGDDPGLALAADGVVESLSTRLSQLRGVHLASPVAAARVNLTDPLTKIAQSLGAKLILHGDVSGTSDKIRIVMSLNEPATGRRLWTQEFSGLKQDILTIQDQIYNQLIAALDLKLTGEDLARGAIRPTEDIGAYGMYLEGRNLLRGKRDEKTLNKALGLFESASHKDPNFALAYTGAADASLSMYDLTKDGVWTNRALGAANRAQQLNETLPEVHFALGSVYNATGKTAEAIAELKRALELAPNSDEAYRRIGRVYLAAGQKDEAIRAFQKAIDSNPYYWLNHNLLGIARVQAGDNNGALASFQKVTELDPSRANGWSNIGSVDHNLGKWEESVAMYKKAADLQPTADNFSNLGAGVFFLGRCDEAKTYFQKAVDLNADVFSLGNLAGAYRCLGQHEQATQYYGQAIGKALQALQINPKDAGTLALLGTYYAKTGDAFRALSFGRRAKALDPNDAQILYQNAIILTITGDRAQALANLREAIQKGFSVKEAAIDPDLKGLANDPAFQKLMKPA